MNAVRQRVRRLPTRNHLYLLVCVLLVEAANRSRSPALVAWSARALGRLAYSLSWRKRRRMEWGLTRIFGPLATGERRRIVRGGFETFWDETLAFVPWRATAGPEPELVGGEHLEAARAAGRGTVLWESGYFGRRNIAKQTLLRHGFGVHQVHDERHRAGFGGDLDQSWLRDAIVLPYFAARERQFTADVIGLSHDTSLAFTRRLAAVLQRNDVLCITADYPQGQRLLTVPLCGEPKAFATGMVSLARQCGAALLPLFCVREPDGRVRVIVEPAVPLFGDDREAAVAAAIQHYAGRLESYIRRYPDQYRSWHYPWWEV